MIIKSGPLDRSRLVTSFDDASRKLQVKEPYNTVKLVVVID